MTHPITLVTTLTVAFTLGCPALADTIDVPTDHGTIQAAIDAAFNGDEIVVAPGVYVEALDYLGKAITVRSTDGAATTWLDADGLGTSAVTFATDETSASVLEGFTLAYGSGSVPAGGGSSRGGAIYIERTSPTIRDCVFQENSAGLGGAVSIFYTEAMPLIDGCTFLGNTATGEGGAVEVVQAYPTLLSCRFFGNTAVVGGAVRAAGQGLTQVINCQFAGNEATGIFCCDGNGGGAINNQQGMTLFVLNSTFVGNLATASSKSRGGAIHSDQVSVTNIANSIFWDNQDSFGFPQLSEIDAVTTVTYSCVEGGWTGAGDDNQTSDPMFVDADGGDNTYGTSDDDAALATGSPCIDAGDDAAVPGTVTTDLLGNARFSGAAVDMGAVENQVETPCAADIDGSGAVGFGDLLTLLGAWGDCAGCDADLDGDDVVAFGDLLVLLAAWGPCA